MNSWYDHIDSTLWYVGHKATMTATTANKTLRKEDAIKGWRDTQLLRVLVVLAEGRSAVPHTRLAGHSSLYLPAGCLMPSSGLFKYLQVHVHMYVHTIKNKINLKITIE